ncbi:MAG TPA: hypothetical protein VEA63_14540, partial [Opitutus sp.]|nr:hypothetical protein [Opitutus sp.]
DQARAEPGKQGTRGGGRGDAQPSDAPTKAATPRPADQHEQRGPGDPRDNFEQPYVHRNLRGGERDSDAAAEKAAKPVTPGPASHQGSRGGGRGDG